jgi:hypothetical protein
VSRNLLVVIGVVENAATDLMLQKLKQDLAGDGSETVHILNFLTDEPAAGRQACADTLRDEYGIDSTKVAYTLCNGNHHFFCVNRNLCNEDLTIDTFRTAEAGQLFETFRTRRGDAIIYRDFAGNEYTLEDDGQ